MLTQEISDQQIDALLGQLTSKNEKVRASTAESLAEAFPAINDSDRRMLVGNALLDAMGDNSWPVRQAATLILPHLHEARMAESLVNALAKFNHPVLKDSGKIGGYYEEIAQALVRVGPPALEPMINFFMTNEAKFDRHETEYWDPYPAKVVHTYFESVGEIAAKKLISMIAAEDQDDRVFHLLVNCGNGADEPLLDLIKKQGIPSPTFLFADDNEFMVFRGLGAAALLGNQIHEGYKNDLQARIDKAKGSMYAQTPKLKGDYKELFHGAHPVSPAFLTLAALRMEDSPQYNKKSVTKAIMGILEQIGLPAVETILPDLNSEKTKFTAAILLGNLGNPAAIEPLAVSLTTPKVNNDYKKVVIRSLGRIGGDIVPMHILPYLNDADFLVREDTAEALGDFKDGQVVDALIRALNDQAWQVRLAAAVALGKIGDARAVPGLIALLGDKGGKILGMGKGVRDFAAEALEQIGTQEALIAVKDMKTKKR
jgi:HEAT repeat protein